MKPQKTFLYTQKTGVPVYTVLPDSVLRALEATPRVTDTHYFWSGRGKRESVMCHWQMRLKKILDLAQVSKGQGNAIWHRFRDTFAVELLLAGVPIERGLDSFGPSKRARDREALQPVGTLAARAAWADVASAWQRDPALTQKIAGTNQVQISKRAVN